jgi:hypothetical protein
MALPPPTIMERARGVRRSLSLVWDAVRFSTISRAGHQRRLKHWEARVADVLACPECDRLPRVPDAGRVIGHTQIMHNGLKVVKDSYYGWRGTSMFEAARGVHEPQEEAVFAEVLKHVAPGGVMLELGAYWGFYSMWFLKAVPGGRAVLVEPASDNLDLGKANFRLNGLDGEFVQAGVGAASGHDRALGRMVSVDELVEERKLSSVEILHCDIQGFEGDMLRGAERTLAAGKVHFAFISTHNEAVHAECRQGLIDRGFDIIAEADMQATYSYDGILVGQKRGTPGPGPVAISQRPRK